MLKVYHSCHPNILHNPAQKGNPIGFFLLKPNTRHVVVLELLLEVLHHEQKGARKKHKTYQREFEHAHYCQAATMYLLSMQMDRSQMITIHLKILDIKSSVHGIRLIKSGIVKDLESVSGSIASPLPCPPWHFSSKAKTSFRLQTLSTERTASSTSSSDFAAIVTFLRSSAMATFLASNPTEGLLYLDILDSSRFDIVWIFWIEIIEVIGQEIHERICSNSNITTYSNTTKKFCPSLCLHFFHHFSQGFLCEPSGSCTSVSSSNCSGRFWFGFTSQHSPWEHPWEHQWLVAAV